MGPKPRTLQADHYGCVQQHLAPLRDTARVSASPSSQAVQEHHHHLPQESQHHLYHRAELQLSPAVQAFPLQRRAGCCGQQKVTSVRVESRGEMAGDMLSFPRPLYWCSLKASCHWPAVLSFFFFNTCVACYHFMKCVYITCYREQRR